MPTPSLPCLPQYRYLIGESYCLAAKGLACSFILKMSSESIRSIVISFEEYERLKNIEQQFENLQRNKNTGISYKNNFKSCK